MSTTRPRDPDRSLPQTSPVDRARSHYFVINPLVTHVRANRQSALDFVVDRFKRHRVTAIGEQHSPAFSSSGRENGCVRMFIRDLVRALHADPQARFRYFVAEFDDAAVMARFGDWRTSPAPPGIANRKAHWLAEGYFRGDPAYREILRAIAQIPEDQVEVVGVDHRVGRLAHDRPPGELTEWLGGRDLQQAPNESPEQFQQRREQVINAREQEMTGLFSDREAQTAENCHRLVLSRLGSDRALIYYGGDHFLERPSPGLRFLSGVTTNTFVRRLIQSNRLSADDIYSIQSMFPGALRRSLSSIDARRAFAHEVELLRILDTLRAEFPDGSIGFDIDEGGFAVCPARHPTDRASLNLRALIDGCIYFRDLNSWNGRTLPPAESMAQYDNEPALSITGVIPTLAGPRSTIFIYGFVLTANTRVTVVTREGSEFACSDVVCINENVIRAKVPWLGYSRQQIDVYLYRQMANGHDILEVLGSAFRYIPY
jgi:hypothetical protein